MKYIRQTIATLVLLLAAALPATAQTNGSNTPYSRYGFGLLSDRAQGFNKGMGGVAYGMQDGKELNAKNPASYASIDSLSFLFDVGMALQNGNFKQGAMSTNAKTAVVDYVNVGCRLAPKLGVSLGLMPFSTIGYSLSNESHINRPTGEVTQTDTYSGDGGLHEVYGGLGWAPFRPLSIGVNAGYIWGDMTHTIMASFSDANISSRRRQYAASVRTYKVDFGLQYNQKLNKHNRLVLGLTYGLGHDIKTAAHYYDQKIVSGTIANGDTLRCPNAYQLPHTYGVGLSWEHKNRLRIGADYTFRQWDGLRSPIVQENPDGTQSYVTHTGDFMNQHSINVGAEYYPNRDGLKWRDHVRYRLGFGYSSPYTRVNGADGPTSYLVSLGAALPIVNYHNNRSIVNLALQYEHVKPKMAGMVTENYIRLNIGISFNEKWFMKWKVE